MSNVRVFLTGFRNQHLNPYIDLLTGSLERAKCQVALSSAGTFFLPDYFRCGKPQIVHFQWISGYAAHRTLAASLAGLCLFVLEVLLLKAMRRRLVWTAHNLHGHAAPYARLDFLVTKFMATAADAIVAHSSSARGMLGARFGKHLLRKTRVIPHGHYIGCYENSISPAEARRMLDLGDTVRVFLLLGGMRENKNVTGLAESFAKGGFKGAVLVIAGAAGDSALRTELENVAASHPNIRLFLEFVPPARVQVFMNAANVVVFPYSDVLTSGAVLLAMTFGRACIAPSVGAFTETLSRQGALFFEPPSPGDLAARLREAAALSAETLEKMGQENFARCRERFGWEAVASATRDLYLG